MALYMVLLCLAQAGPSLGWVYLGTSKWILWVYLCKSKWIDNRSNNAYFLYEQ